MTSKVILTDVQVLAAGTKIERDVESDKPMPVNVVTLLVNPEEAERLTLASTEGKIQLALRNPLDQAIPVTRGVKTAALLGIRRRRSPGRRCPNGVKTMAAGRRDAAGAATGDRRNHSRRQARARSRARAGVT